MMQRSPWDIGKRVLLWILSGITILFGYGLAKLELFAVARELPLTAIDRAIPLVPWTIWIYGSGTLMCLIAWLNVPDGRTARRLYFTLAMSALICWVVFLTFPTTYPRHLWPLPPGDTATLREFADLRATDSPSNCFPSQHVALAWSLALCWADWTRRRWVRIGIVGWAIAVSITTLTTKQHYLVDVPAGFLAGAVSWWAVRSQIAARVPDPPLALTEPRDLQVVHGLLARVRAHQWSLDDLPWPDAHRPPLPRPLVDLLSHTLWIEEIAGLNFALLARASEGELSTLYGLFAEEERRHAEGLRRLLALHGAAVRPPGLGTGLILDQFDTLHADDADDVALVVTATPVFETFLDAGTMPFLARHPALASPVMASLVERIDRDEGAHLAVNWLVAKHLARHTPVRARWTMLLNPNILRGMVAVPALGLETYARAHALGFRFQTLLPAFARLGGLHARTPELARWPLWGLFRVFVVCGVVATRVTGWLADMGVLFIGFWLQWLRVTDRLGGLLFGPGLLRRRRLDHPLR
jgi:membrane-associated phospholipid phosphatase